MNQIKPTLPPQATMIRPSSDGIDLRQQLKVLWRRRHLILVMVVTFVALTWGG